MATTESKQPTCKERVKAEYRARMADLRALLEARERAGRECARCGGSGDVECERRDFPEGALCPDCHGRGSVNCPDCAERGRYDEDGRLAWWGYVWAPGWPSWLAYQGTRAVGLGWFTWALWRGPSLTLRTT